MEADAADGEFVDLSKEHAPDGPSKESIPNWQTPEILVVVYAIMAANKEKPEATQVSRAEFSKKIYSKFCDDMVERKLWHPGKDNRPSVANSVRWRTPFPLSGSTKVSPRFST